MITPDKLSALLEIVSFILLLRGLYKAIINKEQISGFEVRISNFTEKINKKLFFSNAFVKTKLSRLPEINLNKKYNLQERFVKMFFATLILSLLLITIFILESERARTGLLNDLEK